MAGGSVLLVSCSKSKKAGEVKYPAEVLYNSPLFKKSRAYAKCYYSNWYILSAKHGLLAPQTHIKPYDLTLNELSVSERRTWSVSVSIELTKACEPGTKFVILAGKTYSFYLAPILCELGFSVSLPLEGKGIGQRLAWLNNEIAEWTENAT